MVGTQDVIAPRDGAMTNTHSHAEFRRNPRVSKVAAGAICRLGIRGTVPAPGAMAAILEDR